MAMTPCSATRGATGSTAARATTRSTAGRATTRCRRAAATTWPRAAREPTVASAPTPPTAANRAPGTDLRERPRTGWGKFLATRVDFRRARSTYEIEARIDPLPRRNGEMRVMVLIKANEQSERGEMPSERLLTDMTT